MINGRSIHPVLKIALVVVVGYLIVSQLVRLALLPIAVALVAWGGYQIFRSERRNGARTSAERRPALRWASLRRTNRPRASVRLLRIDPNEDLTVPKDWR